MSIIVSGLKKAVGLFRPTLDKEYFLKRLKQITVDHPSIYSQGELKQRLIYQYEDRGDEVSKWLIETAEDKKENCEYRKGAVSCMNFYIRRPEVKECLLKLTEDESYHIREEAIKKLSILKDKNLLSHFAKQLDNDDQYICSAAANALVKIGGQEAYTILKTEIEKATNPNIRYLDDALCDLQEQIADDIRNNLGHGLFSNDEAEMKEKRREIIEKFVHMYSEEEVLSALVSIAVEDYDRTTTYEALNCLEEVEDREKTLKALIKTLRDRS